jgi:ubiquinone/menaquinone biosynthesis methyltransferase
VGLVTLQPDQVREMFDRISPAYDRMNRVMSAGMDGRWRARAVRCAGLAPGGSAIDLCCGTGDLAIALLDAVSTRGRVVGLDFSERMIEAARAKSSQVEWVQGDALDLPFADGEFDAATAIEVLEHVPDAEHTVAEIARVAKRWLLVSVPREPLWRGLNLARGAYWKDLGNTPGHLNHWSKRSFVALLSRHGEVVQARSPFPWTMVLVRLRD